MKFYVFTHHSRSMHMCSNNELNYYNGKLHSRSCIIRLRAESVSHTLDAGISGVYNRLKELEFLRLLQYSQLMLQSILYIDRAALVSIWRSIWRGDLYLFRSMHCRLISGVNGLLIFLHFLAVVAFGNINPIAIGDLVVVDAGESVVVRLRGYDKLVRNVSIKWPRQKFEI